MPHVTATQEDFLTKAKATHGDLFDYSKSVYESRLKKLIIICRTHGEFQQAPAFHYAGQGCLKCARAKQKEWHNRLMSKGGKSSFVRHNTSRPTV